MEKTIIVATGKNAPNGFGVQKYDNDEPWNTLNGRAPNGANATKWLRKTQPDTEKLSRLAAWLVQNVDRNCAGKMPHFDHTKRVRCYSDKTVAAKWREDAENTGYFNCRFFKSRHDAVSAAENMIKCYGEYALKPLKIDDFLFDLARFSETDEQYWNRQAVAIISTGAVRVEIGNEKFHIVGDN
jgi:hypothetical protein